MKFEEAARIALLNIAKHGDTDIFPFPSSGRVADGRRLIRFSRYW